MSDATGSANVLSTAVTPTASVAPTPALSDRSDRSAFHEQMHKDLQNKMSSIDEHRGKSDAKLTELATSVALDSAMHGPPTASLSPSTRDSLVSWRSRMTSSLLKSPFNGRKARSKCGLRTSTSCSCSSLSILSYPINPVCQILCNSCSCKITSHLHAPTNQQDSQGPNQRHHAGGQQKARLL